jgi:hypothetical protein
VTKLASNESSQEKNPDLLSLEAVFCEIVIQMHNETHPTLDGLAENWIKKSSNVVHYARIEGHQALINFLSQRRSKASQREKIILEAEIQKLKRNAAKIYSIPRAFGFLLPKVIRQINLPKREVLPITIGEIKITSHCVTTGANSKFMQIKMACKSRLAEVKIWLKRSKARSTV